MVTDSELLKHLLDVLKTTDLNTSTAVTVRRKLEEKLDIDLSDKKGFIWKQIDLYLQSLYTHGDNSDKMGRLDKELEGDKGNEDV